MKTLRIASGTWRPDARTLFHFGDYRIPLDMSEDMAARAVAEGVGEIVAEAKPAATTYETKPARRPAAKGNKP